MSFWNDLFDRGKPVVGLSPMDGVTDAAMRYMSAKYGNPDVMFTEFVSVDALAHAHEAQSVDKIMKAFVRARDVGPLTSVPYEVAQVFGHTPELFYQAAVMIATLGYDGMDINMGCPSHKVEEHGSGAGLIRTPEVAKEIVRQAKQAIADWVAGRVSVTDLAVSEEIRSWVLEHAVVPEGARIPLPVSVKTRIGIDHDVVEEWMRDLMEVSPAVISLHGRTLKQLYQGSADWSVIAKAASVVHAHGGHIFGNGDIASLADLLSKAREFGVDGGLIGRAAEGNPEVFIGTAEPSREQLLAWAVEHAGIYARLYGVPHFIPMRKHLAWYAHGFPGAGELRSQLMTASSSEDVKRIIQA